MIDSPDENNQELDLFIEKLSMILVDVISEEQRIMEELLS